MYIYSVDIFFSMSEGRSSQGMKSVKGVLTRLWCCCTLRM